MHKLKMTRLAAYIAVAAGLAACGADGGNGTNTNTNTDNNAAQICAELAAQPNEGAIDTVQGVLCDLTNGVPGVSAVNDLLNGLIAGTPLELIVTQLNNLTGDQLAQLNELLTTLLGGDEAGALTPVIKGLNAVLVGLLSGDPASITAALQNIAAGAGGASGGTGTPLDALFALGSGDNPLLALLSQLPGFSNLPGVGGGGGSTPPTGENAGLITSVQELVDSLTHDTQLSAISDLVNTLLDPSSGALAALTGQLDDLTDVNGGPIAPLTEVINGLIAKDDAALAPVITALNGVLVGLLTNQDPAAIAAALQGLATGLAAGGGDNPLAGLIPGGGGSTPAPGANNGLIESVESIVANLTDDTALAQLQDLVSGLVGIDDGALAAITAPLNQLTADQLSFLTDLVDQLAVDEGSPVGAVVDGLNQLIGGLLGGLTGGLPF